VRPTEVGCAAAHPGPPPAIQKSTFSIYRLFDLGQEIDLDTAHSCIAEYTAGQRAAARAREASSIQVARQPIRAKLGPALLQVGERTESGLMRDTIYDLGVVALAIEVVLPRPLTEERWPTSSSIPPSCVQFTSALDLLEAKLLPADADPLSTGVFALWSSHLAVPLVGLDRVIGLIFVGQAAADTYTEGDLSMLSLVAAMLAAYLAAIREQSRGSQPRRPLADSRSPVRYRGSRASEFT
jgi:GAF domain-containing protein